MLSKEQEEQLKSQIISQIEATFPEHQKANSIEKIKSMNSENLEQFIKQNQAAGEPPECIFCSIIKEKTNSYKIGEIKGAIAILEINPISIGHVLIIPNKHLLDPNNLPKYLLAFSKKISEKIKKILNPKEILIQNSNIMGHEIINIIPVYDNENLQSERKSANLEELEILQKQLLKKAITKKSKSKKSSEKTPKEKPQKEIPKEKYRLPRIIP